MADAEAEWESEDFEPTVFKKPILHTDRWEGEDEDEDVKDNWDDEDEEKEEEVKEEEKPEQIVAFQPKKKKALSVIIAEKEEKKRKELEEKMKLLENEQKEMTPEDRLAQKLKQQKLQEESDLELAKETFGVDQGVQGLDEMKPTSKEDFDNFRKLLVEKICNSEDSPHFINFLEDLCRDVCVNVQPDDIKKITTALNALAHEKTKVLKAKAKKKSSKKATLNIRDKDDFTIMDYDEFEDCI